MKTRKMVLMLSIAFALFSGCQTIVYTHRDMSGPEATWGKPQIYIMRHNGTHQTNLSNRNRDEYSPDVRHDGKIVFLAGARQIYVMDIDGGNVAPVPNGPTDAGYPRWSRGQAGGDFILFSHPFPQLQSAIYRIASDGSGLTRITNPAPTQMDELADSIDDKHIVFVRYDSQNNNRDLYVKYIWDDRPEVRLTNTPDWGETAPVVSHDGKLLAYRVYPGLNQPNGEVHVARFTSETSITVLHTITLQPPADNLNISGIDFSKDDTMLFISAPASDVPGTLINRKEEVFKVRLDGTHQVRLTNNSDQDHYPSAAP